MSHLEPFEPYQPTPTRRNRPQFKPTYTDKKIIITGLADGIPKTHIAEQVNTTYAVIHKYVKRQEELGNERIIKALKQREQRNKPKKQPYNRHIKKEQEIFNTFKMSSYDYSQRNMALFYKDDLTKCTDEKGNIKGKCLHPKTRKCLSKFNLIRNGRPTNTYYEIIELEEGPDPQASKRIEI